MTTEAVRWPALPIDAWADTCATLHMWTQIVGKVRLALAPPINHWWHVTFGVTPRGLTTHVMPYAGGFFEMQFDFIDHRLRVETSDGRSRTLALAPQSVSEFYARVLGLLRELGITVRIWPMPVEVPSPVRFDRDHDHKSYDSEWVTQWWRVLSQADDVLREFRGEFIGKSSPVHFFWGSFDLAVTRFSGRRAPEREGADRVTREAYSHEVSSVGFWPGSAGVSDAVFYAYAAPEPPGFKTAKVAPPAAFYSRELGEFILKYEDMRTAPSPRAALLDFARSTYEAGASLAEWDRSALERHERI
jgi:Family of unknown function (DUF5996)